MHGHLWWFVDRAAGMTSWTLLALSTGFGVATATRVVGNRGSAAWTLALHRFLGALAIAFLGVHVVGVVASSYVDISLAGALVPFATDWHPGAMAWGIVALWLLVAVEATSLVRQRIPQSLWRWVHLSSYVLFFGSTVHLLMAGSDASTHWLRLGAVAATGVIAFLTIAAAMEGSTAPQS